VGSRLRRGGERHGDEQASVAGEGLEDPEPQAACRGWEGSSPEVEPRPTRPAATIQRPARRRQPDRDRSSDPHPAPSGHASNLASGSPLGKAVQAGAASARSGGCIGDALGFMGALSTALRIPLPGDQRWAVTIAVEGVAFLGDPDHHGHALRTGLALRTLPRQGVVSATLVGHVFVTFRYERVRWEEWSVTKLEVAKAALDRARLASE
jgi:hypothetical protein